MHLTIKGSNNLIDRLDLSSRLSMLKLVHTESSKIKYRGCPSGSKQILESLTEIRNFIETVVTGTTPIRTALRKQSQPTTVNLTFHET